MSFLVCFVSCARFYVLFVFVVFFFSSRRRHTRCALVTGVQTCALPIWSAEWTVRARQPASPLRSSRPAPRRAKPATVRCHRPTPVRSRRREAKKSVLPAAFCPNDCRPCLGGQTCRTRRRPAGDRAGSTGHREG